MSQIDWGDSAQNEMDPFSFPSLNPFVRSDTNHPSVPTMPSAWPPRGAEGKGSSQGPGFFRPFFLPEKFGWKIPLPGVSMAAHFRHGGAQGLLEILGFLRQANLSVTIMRSPMKVV